MQQNLKNLKNQSSGGLEADTLKTLKRLFFFVFFVWNIGFTKEKLVFPLPLIGFIKEILLFGGLGSDKPIFIKEILVLWRSGLRKTHFY